MDGQVRFRAVAARARFAGALYALIFLAAPSGSENATPLKLVVTLLADTGVALLFYGLFAPVNQRLSLLATLFRLVYVAVMATVSLNFFGMIDLGGTTRSASAFDAGYGIALAPFGLSCVLVGMLILQSRLVPRFLGALVAIAGLGYMTFLWPPLGHRLFFPYLVVPGVVGEGSLTLWLLVMGAKSPHELST